jgi:RimJ/RimL family protein N-acetyltransferase
MMILKPYRAAHAVNLIVREVEEPVKKLPDFENWAEANEGPFAWSAEVDHNVIACGGIGDLWEGVGEAWLLLGKEAVKHRIALCRVILEKLGGALLRYHRIQAHARTDFSLTHMFLRKLGFQVEGLMKAYYPDRMDAILYSIVRDY